MVAKLIAMGLRLQAVSEMSGYKRTWIYNLRQDPAFQQLVLRYRKAADADAVAIMSRLTFAASDSLNELIDRVTKEGSDTETLRKTTFSLLDRIGHGPDRKPGGLIANVQVNVIGSDKLQRMKESYHERTALEYQGTSRLDAEAEIGAEVQGEQLQPSSSETQES